MGDKRIKYRSGYKHQLVEEYSVKTRIKPRIKIETEYIILNSEGKLSVKKGYAWDGASGPVPDTRKVLRASLVHDALYQLMRTQPDKLPREDHRGDADLLFKEVCIEDGVVKSKAKVYYFGLRKFGEKFADPSSRKRIKTAP
jgi:hypothetical protein